MEYSRNIALSNFDVKLINLVHERLDVFERDDHYSATLNEKRTWTYIAKVLGTNVSQCQTRWRKIISAHKRNLLDGVKEKSTKIQSLSTLQTKYSNKIMERLDDIHIAINASLAVTPVQNNQQKQHNENDLSENGGNEQVNEWEFGVGSNNAESYEVEDSIEEQECSEDQRNLQKKMKIIANERNPQEREQSSVKRAQISFEDKYTSTANDSQTDAFFSYIATTVKNLPPRLIVEARMKICQVVGECEIRALEENT